MKYCKFIDFFNGAYIFLKFKIKVVFRYLIQGFKYYQQKYISKARNCFFFDLVLLIINQNKKK